jgi:hypothetical protein
MTENESTEILLPAHTSSYEQPPPGAHIAVCYFLATLGTQDDTYQGRPKRAKKLRLQWELANELTEAGLPMVCGRSYTLSSNDRSRLLRDLQTWRGRNFADAEFGSFRLANLIGAPCMITLIENENHNVNVSSVSPLPKGTPKPTPVNAAVVFNLAQFDAAAFEAIGSYWQDQVRLSPEYQALGIEPAPNQAPANSQAPPAASGEDYGQDPYNAGADDDVPF